jgi:transcription-repair coupling factor (superfamily II helicase)
VQPAGQVFYVVPRVSMIADAERRLEELLPHATVMVAHGKLSGKLQEEVMETFSAGNCQVLVCTTIVEAGLDLPRVNTIIVEEVRALPTPSMVHRCVVHKHDICAQCELCSRWYQDVY